VFLQNFILSDRFVFVEFEILWEEEDEDADCMITRFIVFGNDIYLLWSDGSFEVRKSGMQFWILTFSVCTIGAE